MTHRKRPVNRLGGVVLLCFGAWMLSGQGSVGTARGQAADKEEDAPGRPTAEAVLRRTADFYRKARTIACTLDRVQTTGELTSPSKVTVAFERPNRFAVRPGKGELGITVVSDGKRMVTALAPLRRYTEAEAPASFEALATDPMLQATFRGMIVDSLVADKPYDKLMEGVKSATYVGRETRDGAAVHHLKFTQDEVDWELWVAADGDPLVRRVVLDLTKPLAKLGPLAGELKGGKMELADDFKDWRIDRGLDATAFAYEPPAGWQKVGNLFEALGGGGGDDAPSPLLGKPAPDVDLKLLGEGRFRLKGRPDGSVVVLDFWATWCGPCVAELPILAQVARDYKARGVAFVAVNEQETPEVIRKFLDEKKLEMTVALDSEGKVGEAYGAEAIPLLVLIDKKGIVQSVHVGYDPSIKTTLPKELDALLEGKDLPRPSADVAKGPRPKGKTEGVEPAWSVEGAYASVAVDPKSRALFAVRRDGRCDVLDADGKTTRTFRLADAAHTIVRLARRADGSAGLLAFDPWGPSVLAAAPDGTTLWKEVGGQGVDDVWPADLDGDGADEAIVGYNGSTGLHVFGPDGKRLWKRTDLGNVWHVAAADLDGDGKPEVVTTSARGQVHVFAAADGQPLRTIDAGLYAHMIRTVPGGVGAGPKGDAVLVIGTADKGESMRALGGDGQARWTLELPADLNYCDSLAVSPDGAWAAAGMRGGWVGVIDLRRGRIAAQATDQGVMPIVAWADPGGGGSPLLLVATGREVNAFRVKPVDRPADDKAP